jgi:hypothetical protein
MLPPVFHHPGPLLFYVGWTFLLEEPFTENGPGAAELK